MAYTTTDVEAAIARANGQKLNQIKANTPSGLSGQALGGARVMTPQGGMPYAKSTGHVFAHVATFTQGSVSPDKDTVKAAQAHKSLWADRRTAIDAATELMNSPQAKPGIQQFAAGPAPASPIWLKGIPLDGDYYGYEIGKDYVRKAETGSINFWITAGVLYIYSCYPDGFVAGTKGLRTDTPDLSQLFG
jgi:hypothetical protein